MLSTCHSVSIRGHTLLPPTRSYPSRVSVSFYRTFVNAYIRTQAIILSTSECTSKSRQITLRFTRAAQATSELAAREEMSMIPKGPPKPLKAVFFDLDDTLVLTHEADSLAILHVIALVAEHYPEVDGKVVQKDFWANLIKQPWDPEQKMDVTEWRAGLWCRALKEQGAEDMELAREMQACFDRERMNAFRWTGSVEPMVKALHDGGIKFGIITNGHSKVQRAKLKACNAAALFDIVLVGGESQQKPHPEMFLRACDLAGCSPDEAIMVGDTIGTDIKGAMQAGFLSTVWVNVHKDETPKGRFKPDHTIANFSELQQVLENFGVKFEIPL